MENTRTQEMTTSELLKSRGSLFKEARVLNEKAKSITDEIELIDQKLIAEAEKELQPCPLCSNTGASIRPDNWTNKNSVICNKCGCSVDGVGIDDVVRKWNRRPEPKAVKPIYELSASENDKVRCPNCQIILWDSEEGDVVEFAFCYECGVPLDWSERDDD